MDTNKLKSLTPAGIPSTDFGDVVANYSQILGSKTKLEKEIAQTEHSMKKLFVAFDITVRFKETTDLVGLSDKLSIYKPVTEEQKDGLVYACARIEGRAFSEIVSNPPLMKRLEKKFGPTFKEFFRQVDDAFHMTGDENVAKKEVDEDKTKDVTDQYAALEETLIGQRINLQETEAELSNVDKYIDFCKKIVALAPAGGKPQQQNQKPQQ